MSAINDALNKAGKENPAVKDEKNLGLKGEFRPEFLNKKHPTNWGPLFVLLVLLIVTAPILAPVFSVRFKNAELVRQTAATKTSAALPTATASQQAPAGQNVKAQFAIEETPAAAFVASARPMLALNGIVMSPTNHSDSYCLINGKIIKVGEGIDGAKLIKVTPNEVTLDYRGETIVLPVSA